MTGFMNVSLFNTGYFYTGGKTAERYSKPQEAMFPYKEHSKGFNKVENGPSENSHIKVTNPLNKNGTISGVITDIQKNKDGKAIMLSVQSSTSGRKFRYIYDSEINGFKQENTDKIYDLSEKGELVRRCSENKAAPFRNKMPASAVKSEPLNAAEIAIKDFDEKGRLVLEKTTDGKNYQYTYRYDDSKQPNRKIELGKDGNPVKITCFEYDKDGNMTDVITRDPNGKLLSCERLEYKDGEVLNHYHNYVFDDRMKILAADIKDKDGNPKGRMENTYGRYTGDSAVSIYNNNHELIKKKYTDIRGKITETVYSQGKQVAQTERQDPFRG